MWADENVVRFTAESACTAGRFRCASWRPCAMNSPPPLRYVTVPSRPLWNVKCSMSTEESVDGVHMGNGVRHGDDCVELRATNAVAQPTAPTPLRYIELSFHRSGTD